MYTLCLAHNPPLEHYAPVAVRTGLWKLGEVVAGQLNRSSHQVLAGAAARSAATLDHHFDVVTVCAGLKNLDSDALSEPSGEVPSGRLGRCGGGRKRLTDMDPELTAALERQLEPVTHGDPESPLRWTCNSAARLADHLLAEGHLVSERAVNRLLHTLGYSLQANHKILEGSPAARRPSMYMTSPTWSSARPSPAESVSWPPTPVGLGPVRGTR